MKVLSHGLLVFLSVFASTLCAQTDSSGNDLLYIIYDSSNSMWGELRDKSRKYEASRKAITATLESNTLQRNLAFRVYGHRRAGDCRDSEMMVAPSPFTEAKSDIYTAVEQVRPTGKTPITYSLRQALHDFDDRNGDILLISDGIETCDIDPCSLMNEWRDQGISIRVHVVGVGLNDVERNAMECVADASGGRYFDAGSEDELLSALDQASGIVAAEPAPIQQKKGYAIILSGIDEQGRSLPLEGKLYSDGNAVTSLTSNGRNVITEPGSYRINVGVILQDGTLYKPVQREVEVTTPGETELEITVSAPASVSAQFTENGESISGSGVSAWQDGQKIFQFRSTDSVLARPGVYEFRSTPNTENELRVNKTLIAAEHTIVQFDLVNTVKVRFQYTLPDGETDQRTGQLFQDDQLVASTYTNRFVTVLPGTYELRDKFSDPLNALSPTQVIITADEEQIIEIPMNVGYIATTYTGADRDFLNRNTTRVFIHAINNENGNSIGSVTSATDRIEVAKPGLYRVHGHDSAGYFDPVEIVVEPDKTVTAELIAKPTADVSVSYPAADYEREPDRAFLVPLDDQQPHKTYMSTGAVLKVPPGRYRIDPHGVAGTEPLLINLSAGTITHAVFEKPL